MKAVIDARRQFLRDWSRGKAARHYSVMRLNYGSWHTNPCWDFRGFFFCCCDGIFFRDRYSFESFSKTEMVKKTSVEVLPRAIHIDDFFQQQDAGMQFAIHDQLMGER